MEGVKDMKENTQASFWMQCFGTTPRDRRNEMKLAGISLLWALCFVGGKFLITSDLLPAGPISWLIAALPSVAAVFLLVAYGRFLRQTDELQRLIQLQALALGFGGGFFAICGYSLFQELGAPAVDAIDALAVMPFFYVFGTFLGWRRYR